jgi:uncharacterized protein with ParB-like and HNH nuclease domain
MESPIALNIYKDKDNIFNKDDKYVVPLYQRAYAWSDDEISQLIEDINGYDGENYHIGSLIVHQREDKSFEVIDGQQRLTTLFLLLLYLGINVKENLSFDCRRKSNLTLQNLVKKYVDKTEEKKINDTDTEESLISGIKIIEDKFIKDDIDKNEFKKRLSKVILYRIEVPKHTDLNRYFEIMNTRGEQLEQADILKALFMERIDNVHHNAFAKIWEACADMTGYVQMNMPKELRKNIFGDDWKQMPQEIKFLKDLVSDQSNKKNETDAIVTNAPNNDKEKIDEILGHNYNDYSPERIDEEGERVRFDSAISFTYFLLHVLRIFKCIENSNQATNTGLLDDMQLLKEYRELLKDKEKDEDLPLRFIDCLLKCRFLFDKYIIKREYREDNPEGKWSIKQLNKSEKDTAYYTETFSSQKSNCLMLQAAMRVSFTSPKVMHWITELVLWLFKNDEVALLTNEAEGIAALATKENFLDEKDYKLGVTTPHIVFNFLDYLLWKNNKNKYSNFEFEFRNSVEHWYPQNPSDGSFESWNDKDTFGNLCIISRSVNSKFSNLSPESKMKSYGKMVEKGSLKLRLMGEIIQQNSNDDWIENYCKKHEEEMISILENACRKIM